jgi:hypothetical protein
MFIAKAAAALAKSEAAALQHCKQRATAKA